MKPGTVFFKKNFQFPDGDISDKLFVLMAQPRDGKYLAVKTTTQEKSWRARKQGCHADKGYFYFSCGTCWFNQDTWIILDDPYLLESKEVQRWFREGAAEVKTQLALTDFAAIKNCLKQVEDISDEMLQMLG